jgi:hypothetical protein
MLANPAIDLRKSAHWKAGGLRAGGTAGVMRSHIYRESGQDHVYAHRDPL